MRKEPLVFILESRVDYLNLYCLNLLVYVQADFVICDRFDELTRKIEENNPDLILMNIPNDEKSEGKVKKINSLLKEKVDKPICFVNATVKENYPELIINDGDFSVKELISSIARKMQISAEYMSKLHVDAYYPIPIKYILPGWQATQPLFQENKDGSFEQVLNKGEVITNKFIKLFNTDANIFCMSRYRLEVVNSFTSNIKSILESENLSTVERIAQTEIAFEMISQSIASVGLPETTLRLAKSSIRSMEKLVLEIPSISSLYNLLVADQASHRFKHMMLLSYLGQYFLKDQTWSNYNITQQWSYLCFFHDIVLDRDEYLLFEFDDDVKSSSLSDKEKTIILNHAQLAARMISQVKELPSGIDTLIKQHHGSKMGNSISSISISISPLCIIFILVEKYVHFFLSNNESKKSAEEISVFVEGLFKTYPFPTFRKYIPTLRTIPLRD
jgi:response regulator RpfG family c-di-GMP phosphodiesterase